jgi:hypothetical protein
MGKPPSLNVQDRVAFEKELEYEIAFLIALLKVL